MNGSVLLIVREKQEMNFVMKVFTSLSDAWRAAIVCLTLLVTIGFFGYLLILALPVALSAVSSGRGVTLSGLEISPNKACEQAEGLLTGSAPNNELGLYNELIDKLLRSSESALMLANAQKSQVEPNLFLKRAQDIFELIGSARTEQDKISQERTNAFEAIKQNCLQREQRIEHVLTGKVLILVLGLTFSVLSFFAFVLYIFRPTPATEMR